MTIVSDGCISDPIATTTVTVNALPVLRPSFVYNPNTDCSPTDLELFGGVIGGVGPYSYRWEGPNGFASTSATPVIANAAFVNNGSYNLTVTDANGCSTLASLEVSGIVDSQFEPVISSSGVVCEGGEITLSIPAYNGASIDYRWLFNGTPVNGLPNYSGEQTNTLTLQSVNATQAGRYIVIVLVNGCILTSDPFDVDVFDNPTVSVASPTNDICYGDELIISANTTNAISYEWNGPNGFTSNAQELVIANATEANNGGYTLEIANANGCTAATSFIVNNILPEVQQPIVTSNGPVCEDLSLIHI